MRLRFHISAVVLLAMAAAGRGANPETLEGLVQKSDLLVVAQVKDIQNLRKEPSERWGSVLLKRATLRVIRGIHPADGSPAAPEEITVDYPTWDTDVVYRTPLPRFSALRQGEVFLFPLKQNAAKSGWEFVDPEDVAMIMPAAPRPLVAQPNTPREFLLHELAAAFANGDFQNMRRAGTYLSDLGAEKNPPPLSIADSIFALLRAEIGETILREDSRWFSIAIASYNSTPTTRPSFADLINQPPPAAPSLQLARLTLSKTSQRDLDVRILQFLVNHQEDNDYAPSIALSLEANFANDPRMLAMERSALADGKPGTMQVANLLIKDAKHPLAPAAAAAAREFVNLSARPFVEELNWNATNTAVALLLRLGSDDDFAFFLNQIRRARQRDNKAYVTFLLCVRNLKPTPTRTLEIARQYIDDTSPLMPIEESTRANLTPVRLCDVAASIVSFAATPPFDAEKRDDLLEKARAYLKSNE